MKIHEYQARRIYREHGITTPRDALAETPEDVESLAKKLGGRVVVKAQVHVGGRGKAGGVKLAESPEEARRIAEKILGMNIKGLIVKKVLLSKTVDIEKETYLGITIDRQEKKIVLIGTSSGGVEIEQLARDNPDAIVKMHIDPSQDVPDSVFADMGNAIFPESKHASETADFLKKLYEIFMNYDCSLAEINPLVVDVNDHLIAADAKINFDDNALFRHPEILQMRDPEQENPKERDAKEKGLSFVDLDGDIGCMVNGAGLAMATMDMIKMAGGEPANFLDVGGSSNPEKVINAFKIILSNPKVRAVVVNIFGGITRCDDVARGIMQAVDSMKISVPVCIRLTGTNEEKAANMLKDTELITAETMFEVIKKAVSLTENREGVS